MLSGWLVCAGLIVISTSCERNRGGSTLRQFIFALVACAGCAGQNTVGGHDAWDPLPSMPFPSAMPGAATGSDGRIYVVAGDQSESASFDPETQKWTTTNSSGAFRAGSATVSLSGLIYVIGGLVDQKAVPATLAYDPVQDSWTNLAPTRKLRLYASATVGADGRIYVVGGDNGGLLPTPAFATATSAEVYDPATNSWSQITHPNHTREGLCAATGSDGRIYAIGGIENTGTGYSPASTVEVYDPKTNTWSDAPPLPTARGFMAAVTSGGHIFVIGGTSQFAPIQGVGTGLSIVEVYDGQTWSTAKAMPTGRAELAAATASDGRIYAFGGKSDVDSAEYTIEVYTP